MNRGACWAIVHGGMKSWTGLSDQYFIIYYTLISKLVLLERTIENHT